MWTIQQETMSAWRAECERAAAELAAHLEGDPKFNLFQGIVTQHQRLMTLPLLCLPSGGLVLDVGTAAGSLAMDMAKEMGGEGRVFAVDVDDAMLEAARSLADKLRLPVETLRGDVYALPFQDGTFDVAVARFLFQHLSEPAKALAEMRRVVRPGGIVAVIDVDDGTLLEDPPLPPQAAALYRAVAEAQSRRGGDRFIGRKLYRLLREAGMHPVSVFGIPRIQLGQVSGGRSDEILAHHLNHLTREKESILDAGLLSAEDFEAGLTAIRESAGGERFVYDVEFVSLGAVPQSARVA